jgi:hypothetical protein
VLLRPIAFTARCLPGWLRVLPSRPMLACPSCPARLSSRLTWNKPNATSCPMLAPVRVIKSVDREQPTCQRLASRCRPILTIAAAMRACGLDRQRPGGVNFDSTNPAHKIGITGCPFVCANSGSSTNDAAKRDRPPNSGLLVATFSILVSRFQGESGAHVKRLQQSRCHAAVLRATRRFLLNLLAPALGRRVRSPCDNCDGP